MAVAELYINSAGPDTLTLDFSPHIRGLVNPKNPQGYAFLRTLGCLGFEHKLLETDMEQRLQVQGSLELAQASLPVLRQQRGLIAHNAARRSVSHQKHNQRQFKRILDGLVDQTLPALQSGTSLPNLAFTLAYPFGKEIHDNGVRGHTGGCVAPWRASPAERELQAERLRLFARLDCIPMNPVQSAEQDLEELAILPDQRGWHDRQAALNEAQRIRFSIELLETSGYLVTPVDTVTA